ncbi:MAG: hypothetical protein JXR73_01535 [Candidatus Omnitrophica bacterium]|nr:hypothetical protein [Candidatus Omnitrophota bacterium]
MNELLTIVLAVGIWYALMRFILPALGIPTCMTGACQMKKTQMNKERESQSVKKETESYEGE